MSIVINPNVNNLQAAGGIGSTEDASAPEASRNSPVSESCPPPRTTANEDSINSTPPLEKPSWEKALADIPMPPSLGATVLAMIGDVVNEARQAAAEQRYHDKLAVVDKLHQQADTIREQAKTQLITGIISASISIAASAVSIAGAVKGLKDFASSAAFEGLEGDALANAQNMQSAMLQTSNMKYQGISQAVSSLSSVASQTGGYISAGYDAQMKMQEAEIEQMRALITQIDSVYDSLKEVIAKATSVQDAIQQSTNQTRTRILS